LTKKIIKIAPMLEVNPARVEASELPSRISHVTQLAFDVLTAVFTASKKFPLPIAHIVNLLSQKLGIFTSADSASRTAVGTIIMLKLVGPMLCSTNGLLSYIKSKTKGKKGIDYMVITKGLITVAKVLQAIANGVEYEPESYMSCFNDFIRHTTPIYLHFTENIIKLGGKTVHIVDDLSPRRLVKEWTNVHTYLTRNKDKVKTKCLLLDNMTASTGVDGITGEALAQQLDRAIDIVTAERQRAELANLDVFM